MLCSTLSGKKIKGGVREAWRKERKKKERARKGREEGRVKKWGRREN